MALNILKNKLGEILNPIIPRYERLTKYSTDEVKTGKKWTNGKDIYRKVFNINIDTTEAGWKEVGTVEFDEITDSYYVCTTQSEPNRNRPNSNGAGLSFDNNKCYVAGTGEFTSTRLYLKKVVVEYTKK